MATNTDDIKLPDFMTKRWQDTPTIPTPSSTRRPKPTRADKAILVITTAILTAAATFGWAVVMNGVGKLPVLRVTFYTPGDM